MDRRLMQAKRSEISLILGPMRFIAYLGEASWAVLAGDQGVRQTSP